MEVVVECGHVGVAQFENLNHSDKRKRREIDVDKKLSIKMIRAK